METKELARRIWEERQRMAAKDKRLPIYMLNINHPAIRALYDTWKDRTGRRSYDAPSEQDRTEFELSIVGPEAIRALEQHFETVDRLRETMRGKRNAE